METASEPLADDQDRLRRDHLHVRS